MNVQQAELVRDLDSLTIRLLALAREERLRSSQLSIVRWAATALEALRHILESTFDAQSWH